MSPDNRPAQDMARSGLQIRGTSEGLVIELGCDPWEGVLAEIERKLSSSADFFRGGRVAVRAGTRRLDRQEITNLGSLLLCWGVTLWALESESPETRMAAASLGLEIHTGDAGVAPGEEHRTPASVAPAEGHLTPASQGILVRRTLRSGASLAHEGHIIILGDVNPGAEVVAGQDILVWGRLRGLAHAGAGGNPDAVVCALRLQPAQIRIGHLALAPNEPGEDIPRLARVEGSRIVLEPWTETGRNGEVPARAGHALGRLGRLWRRE